MESTQPRRKPALELEISQLSGNECRAALLGTLSKKDTNKLTAVLSFESANINISFQDPQQLAGIDDSDFVRVIGRTVFNNDVLSINVETIHKIKDFDKSLWEKVREKERVYLND